MYGTDRTVVPVTILSGTALSAEVNVNGKRIVGIQMPAAWTPGALTFQALIGQAGQTPTFGEVVDSANAAVSITTPTQGTYIALADTLSLIGLGRLKVRSGTSGVPVNQGADRVIGLVCVDR